MTQMSSVIVTENNSVIMISVTETENDSAITIRNVIAKHM